MVFSRQEYWSGLPFPSPGDFPNPGIEPASPALAGGFFTIETPGKPHMGIASPIINIPPPKWNNLLQLMSLHWYIILFTHNAVHSMVLDKCLMTYIYHSDIIQNIFTVLNILCAPCIHPSHQHPEKPLIFLLTPKFCLEISFLIFCVYIVHKVFNILYNSQVVQWRIRLPSRSCGFDPWVKKIPWRGNGNQLQYFCLENPMDRGA